MTSARLRLVQMHIRLGETEQARTALQKIRELVPNSPAAIILLAELDVRSGHYTDAIAALQDLTRKQPSSAVFDLLGQAYGGEQRHEEATAAFRTFAEAAPDKPADGGFPSIFGEGIPTLPKNLDFPPAEEDTSPKATTEATMAAMRVHGQRNALWRNMQSQWPLITRLGT